MEQGGHHGMALLTPEEQQSLGSSCGTGKVLMLDSAFGRFSQQMSRSKKFDHFC